MKQAINPTAHFAVKPLNLEPQSVDADDGHEVAPPSAALGWKRNSFMLLARVVMKMLHSVTLDFDEGARDQMKGKEEQPVVATTLTFRTCYLTLL